MESVFEEEEDQEWPDEEEMGATANKQHDITAPGMSEITSALEFKVMCAGFASELESLQSPIPPEGSQHLTVQAQQMGVSRQKLKEIQELCK